MVLLNDGANEWHDRQVVLLLQVRQFGGHIWQSWFIPSSKYPEIQGHSGAEELLKLPAQVKHMGVYILVIIFL